MTAPRPRDGRPPPRWLLEALWALHRSGYVASRGRFGLRGALPDRLGTLRLRTLGRYSGRERACMLFYLEDGPNLAVVASNAGDRSEPEWWRNLQAAPEAFVDLVGGDHAVIGRRASPAEQERLWSRFVAGLGAYQSYAAMTERAIPVVILEPADPDKPVRATA